MLSSCNWNALQEIHRSFCEVSETDFFEDDEKKRCHLAYISRKFQSNPKTVLDSNVLISCTGEVPNRFHFFEVITKILECGLNTNSLVIFEHIVKNVKTGYRM